MGDFDRNPSSGGKNEQKKVIVLALLGVVLLGVGVYHFRGGSPQAAIAATGAPGAVATASPTDTPEQVIEALRQNPLKNLTQPSTGTSFEVTPRNPFTMAEAW